jgi:hypothetical protein
VAVSVEQMQFIARDEDLPTIDELTASRPDFTGTLTTDEYVRQMRDG